MESTRRLERAPRFCECQPLSPNIRCRDAHLHLSDLVLSEPKFLQRSKAFQVLNLLYQRQPSRSIWFIVHARGMVGAAQTRIRLAPSSKFSNLVNPSSPSIREILFCAKNSSVNSVRCETFLICLILLKLRSRLVRWRNSSNPLRWEMRLS